MLASDIELKDIAGIGTTTSRKMIAAGLTSVYDLATQTPAQLMELIKCTKDSATEYILNAQKLLRENGLIDKEFMTAEDVEKSRNDILRLSTGSKVLDTLLLGGIESKAVTEFYGEFGSGKSQVCHTVCALAHQAIEKGGLGGGVIYIDTEGTFRPERLRKIAELRGFDVSHIMKNTMNAKVYSASHLEVMVKNLGKYVQDFKAKLIIVDSITNLHRSEYLGRGMLADRQHRLSMIMHKLIRTAEIYNVAVIITNQVSTAPDTMFGDPTRPTGGNVIGHASTYRIYLRKAGEDRIARMVDSPYHPYSEGRFTVSDAGVQDTEEELKKMTA